MNGSQFQYDGQLIYSIYQVHLEDDTELLDRIINKIGGSEQENPPTTHVKQLDIDQLLASTSFELKLPYSGIDALRYIDKQYSDEVVVYDPEQSRQIEGKQIREHNGEIIMLSPDRLLIKGSESIQRKMVKEIRTILSTKQRLLPLDFHPDFLLWLFYQHNSGADMDTIQPIAMTGAEFQGSMDAFGTSTTIEGGSLGRSPPAIISLLAGKEFKTLRGKFEIYDRYIDLELNTDGRVHVRVAEDIRQSDDLERFILATNVVDELGIAYLEWENLPEKRQYPPLKFFKQLYEDVQNQGVKISFPVDSLLEKYAKKRGEDVEEI